jgi:hypothetical protein
MSLYILSFSLLCLFFGVLLYSSLIFIIATPRLKSFKINHLCLLLGNYVENGFTR